MTFKAIDTQLVIDTATRAATNNGIQLDLQYHGKGIYKGRFGDYVMDPSGSAIQPLLFLRNINDGGHAFMIGVGLYRAVCANGLVVGEDFYSQRIIHREGPTIDEFLNNLDQRLNNAFAISASDFTDTMERLASTQLTDRQAFNIIYSLNIPESIKSYAWHYWLNPIRKEEDARTLWTLYNVLNEMNRRRTTSVSVELDRELTLLQNIDALHTHNMFLERTQLKVA